MDQNQKSFGSRIKSFDIFEKLPDDMAERSGYGKVGKYKLAI